MKPPRHGAALLLPYQAQLQLVVLHLELLHHNLQLQQLLAAPLKLVLLTVQGFEPSLPDLTFPLEAASRLAPSP